MLSATSYHVDKDLFFISLIFVLVDHFIDLLADTLNSFAAFTDNDARTGAMDMDPDFCGVPFNFNAGNTCII